MVCLAHKTPDRLLSGDLSGNIGGSLLAAGGNDATPNPWAKPLTP
jgi:hypothetical protein